LKAIKAAWQTILKSYLTVKILKIVPYLKSAKRGYVAVSNHMSAANAEGLSLLCCIPSQVTPQANTAEHFFLVALLKKA